ncbi:RMD1 family protein [Sphingomonas yunnanensis]|uniref:RMD1 family protein n=1 Tax=Sphingomonas yunnanensis TaxID=310400 RepID=UPI001CA6F341|nr:RMD1 family protein [Sphingomonas yunnanensis]MBY9063630.1 RMD1 family protein [Sphingomonas yunnanensis]
MPVINMPALRPTGLPEALVMPLPGRGDQIDMRAHLLGTRIDMRALAGFGDPELVELGGSCAFVFRYGAVVLVGATSEEEARILAQVAPHAVDPPTSPEIETARVELRDDGDETVSADGRIRLREATPERLLLAATVLARSVVLARDEMRIEDAFDRIEPLLVDMREHGRAHLPIRQIMRQIGSVLSAQHRVVGRARIGEKPDLLWEHPELDRLYGRLEAEYELGDRTRTIERKLEMLGDSAEWLLDLVQDKRSLRLELSVVALIAFEVAIGLYEIAARWPH